MRLWVLLLPLLLFASKVRVDTTKAFGIQKRFEIQAPFALEHPRYYLEAGFGVYEQNLSKVRLYNQVELLDTAGLGAYATKATLKLDQDRFKFDNFFFNEHASSVWVEGEKAEGNKTKISLEHAFVSSCDVECSDWKFNFGWGTLDRTIHWVNLYNIALFVDDVPIFYFPYVGFSTLKKRHTGFLRPTLGISNKEGIIYIQPFFYAPTNWWDLEFDPQIRTKRGKGIYSTFRFVDSPTSYGEIRTGIFKEKESYMQELGIKNRYHRGAEFYYRKNGIFSKKDTQDGFYLDYKIYNDVDYFNLQKQLSRGFTATLDISRLNYFYANDDNYFGLSARYFKYNNRTSSSELFHILPALNYHRFVRTPLRHFNLAYYIDAQITNYYQRGGYDALEYNLHLPIKLYFTFLEGYLGFSVSERLNFLFIDYYDRKATDQNYKDYRYFRNAHDLSLYGDVVRPYKEFLHTVSYSASLLLPSFESERGDRAKFTDIEEYRKSLDISLRQYFQFYNKELFFYHFLTQSIDYDSPDDRRYLENELGISTKNYDLNFNLLYSYKTNSLESFTTTASYRGDRLKANMSYIYHTREGATSGQEIDTQFLRADLSKDLANHNELFATIDYNLEQKRYKAWGIGWKKRERCWSLLMRYKKDTIPILTSAGTGFYYDNTFLIRLELYPLGGIERSFSKSSEQRTF